VLAAAPSARAFGESARAVVGRRPHGARRWRCTASTLVTGSCADRPRRWSGVRPPPRARGRSGATTRVRSRRSAARPPVYEQQAAHHGNLARSRHRAVSEAAEPRARLTQAKVDKRPGSDRPRPLGRDSRRPAPPLQSCASRSNSSVTTVGATGSTSAPHTDRVSGQPAASILVPAAFAS
jgi:hypothetical protein